MARSNVFPIVTDHWATLKGTGGPLRKWSDLAWNVGLPIATFAGTLLADPSPDRTDVAAILTVVGILTGLLFQLLVSVLSSLRQEAERTEPPRHREEAEQYVDLLTGLDSNISYAVLVGVVIAAGLGFGLIYGQPGWTDVGNAIAAALLTNFGATVLMVLKRYRAMSNAAAAQARQAIWRTHRGSPPARTSSGGST